MRAKPILVLGGVCLLGLAAMHLIAASTAELPVPKQTAATPPPAPRRAAEPKLEFDIRRRGAEGRSLATSSEREPAQPEPNVQDAIARDRAKLSRIEQDLDGRLRAERVDAAWAHDQERAIASAISDPGFAGLQLVDVSCGATMCRIGLTAGEQVADVDGLVEELTSTKPFRDGGFVRKTSPRSVTMFVTRAGHRLPPAPKS